MGLTATRLRELLDFNPDTGIFSKNGKDVGCRQRAGYVIIGVDGARYYAHRLAWLYVMGDWPNDALDHVNSIRDDNRLCNLRMATRSQNGHNRPAPKSNTSGVKGVVWYKPTRKWCAHITLNHKNINLGYFDTLEQAAGAYRRAAHDLVGEFAHED